MFSPRNSILNHKFRIHSIATPFWSELDEEGNELVDGHVAIKDIPGDVVTKLQNEMKEGKLSDVQFMGALIVRSLIYKDSGAYIFQEADRDAVAQRGLSELSPVFDEINIFFGFNKDGAAVDVAKKNSSQTRNDLPGLESAKPAYIKA